MNENQENFDDIEKEKKKAPAPRNRNALQTISRVVACIPCIPKRVPTPPTPNIDKLKQIYQRFNKEDPNSTDTSILDRIDSHDLCAWSEKIIKFLPSVNDNPNGGGSNEVVSHFKTIKKFYGVVRNAGFDSSPELETFFNSVQIYESVMSIAFVVFQEKPEFIKSIGDEIMKAIAQVEGFSGNGCLAITFCGIAILSHFNTILGAIDKILGDLGLVKVAEFIANIIEVFCRLFNIDIRDTQKITALSESIQSMVGGVSNALSSVFGSSIPAVNRASKWGPLAITKKIQSKLSKFENQSVIVERTVNSFERFFKQVEKVETINDDLEMMTKKESNVQKSSAEDYDNVDPDTQKIDVNPLQAQIQEKQTSILEEVTMVGHFFQHLETILSYGVLLFSNEDAILNPLLDEVDECSRILEKYFTLHPLYKILLGPNYLSKLKVVVKRIIHLIESSNLKINSPEEFLNELRQKYPNLLYLVCESVLNDKLKKKLEFLPDGIENALNGAMDDALKKMKKKLPFF